MNGFLPGGYRDGTSPLHRADGLCKLIAFFLYLAATVLTDTLLGYLPLLAAVMAVCLRSEVGVSTPLRPLWRLKWFFLTVFLLNALFHDSADPLWAWHFLRLSYEGMAAGGHVVCRLALAVGAAQWLTAVTSPLDLIAAIESLLSSFGRLGLPTADIAVILGAALQFIPTLQREAEQIRLAQTARGAPFDSPHLFRRLSAMPALTLPLFLAAFRRADELAMAMEARGYHRGAPNGRKPPRRIGRIDVLLLVLALLLGVLALFWL